MAKLKKHRTFRHLVQGAFALVTNGNLTGFITGKIYQGPLKNFCVPGMNCYSCPGALGACPLGSIQAMFSARRPKIAFYVIGYIALLGVILGRFICGWLCPFGLVQELLHKIPLKKITIPERVDKILRKLKYVFLLVLVILFPIILRDEYGVSFPYFCKWVCPVGMLEGGIPLMIVDEGLRSAAHFLYAWKMVILVVMVLTSIVIHRPFCKYICPLGAFYGLFNRISFLKLKCNKVTCTECGACAKICKMQVDPSKTPNSSECIRCGECVKVCPANSLALTFLNKDGIEKEEALENHM
ncbi:MAG: 4Fe-4S binding protein [Firmicutes bacterium]|nr:4Fe-4S binding protein [Bacillota bacterium]